MKSKLLLIVCLLGQEAFAQVALAPTPRNQNGLAIVTNFNFIDQNKNDYHGDLDVTDMDRVIPYVVKYSYPEFSEGQLIYASGNRSQLVKMNYHQLYGEMQFIGENSDTLFIANADSVSYIRFDECLYLHTSETGYLKILGGNHQIKLGVQEKIKWREVDRTGNPYINVPYEHLVLSKHTSYFLASDSKETWVANKSGFLKAFPTHQRQIKTYLHQMARQRMAIKFYKEEDLVVLMKFCTSLPQGRI